MSQFIYGYLAAKQHRRKAGSKRVKRIMSGLPIDTPLSRMKFKTEQKAALDKIQQRTSYTSHLLAKKRILTPKRLSVVFALSFHLIAVLIGSRYIIQSRNIDDDAIVVEMVETHQLPEKRKMPKRLIPKAMPRKSVQVQAPQFERRVVTTVKIQRHRTQFAVPKGDMTHSRFPTASAVSPASGVNPLGNADIAGGSHARIPSALPNLQPRIATNSSIIDVLEAEAIPEDSVDLNTVKLASADLSEVTQRPRFARRVSPKYPEIARRAETEGVVVLEATIGVDGIAREIAVVTGMGYGCNRAATEALKASRFAPAMHDRSKVAVRIRIPYRFSLKQ